MKNGNMDVIIDRNFLTTECWKVRRVHEKGEEGFENGKLNGLSSYRSECAIMPYLQILSLNPQRPETARPAFRIGHIYIYIYMTKMTWCLESHFFDDFELEEQARRRSKSSMDISKIPFHKLSRRSQLWTWMSFKIKDRISLSKICDENSKIGESTVSMESAFWYKLSWLYEHVIRTIKALLDCSMQKTY